MTTPENSCSLPLDFVPYTPYAGTITFTEEEIMTDIKDNFFRQDTPLVRSVERGPVVDHGPAIAPGQRVLSELRPFIPQGDAERKDAPMFRGLLGYFPAALFAVARHSQASDQKHNPGNAEGPNWARAKSSDHPDCIVRHLIDAGAPGEPDRMYHLAALAWRALALLQEECERNGARQGVSCR